MSTRTKILFSLIVFSAVYPFLSFYFWIHYVSVDNPLIGSLYYFIINIIPFPASLLMMVSRDGTHFGRDIYFASAMNVVIYYLLFCFSWKIYTSCFKKSESTL